MENTTEKDAEPGNAGLVAPHFQGDSEFWVNDSRSADSKAQCSSPSVSGHLLDLLHQSPALPSSPLPNFSTPRTQHGAMTILEHDHPTWYNNSGSEHSLPLDFQTQVGYAPVPLDDITGNLNCNPRTSINHIRHQGRSYLETTPPKYHSLDQADFGVSTTIAPARKARSHSQSRISDPHPRIPRPEIFEDWEINGGGNASGRNLLAIFHGSDGKPRTRYNLRVVRGRNSTHLPLAGYPPCTQPIPGGLTLEEICQQYPRHVWGSCLRMFIAEQMTGEQIFQALPKAFQKSNAVQRPWNFIQQGFTREGKLMDKEDGRYISPSPRRQRCGTFDSDSDLDEEIYSNLSPGFESPITQWSARSSPFLDLQHTLQHENSTQLTLLDMIMRLKRPDLRHETTESKAERVRTTQAHLRELFGISQDGDDLERMRSLTEALREVIALHSTDHNDADGKCIVETAEQAHVLEEHHDTTPRPEVSYEPQNDIGEPLEYG